MHIPQPCAQCPGAVSAKHVHRGGGLPSRCRDRPAHPRLCRVLLREGLPTSIPCVSSSGNDNGEVPGWQDRPGLGVCHMRPGNAPLGFGPSNPRESHSMGSNGRTEDMTPSGVSYNSTSPGSSAHHPLSDGDWTVPKGVYADRYGSEIWCRHAVKS